MSDAFQQVAAHYGDDGIGERILAALRDEGLDVDALTPEILAPIDQFHTRGLAATREQAALLAPGRDMHVLDVGSGVGGPARFLAATFGCRVTGIDLTPEFVAAAEMLTKHCGLDGLVSFRQANALDLPFGEATFDMAWSQNVTMNIADKAAFYAEVLRVLKPGGRFSSVDVAAGPAGPPIFPVPWARRPEISFLVPPEAMRHAAEAAGFRILEWRDSTAETVAATDSAGEQARLGRLGVGLIAGADYPERMANSRRSTAEGRTVNVLMLAEKPG